MKRLLNKAIALALMAATWVGCVQEDYYLNTGQESESDIQISLNLSIPDPVLAVTRAGVAEAIENLTVLCFDGQGLALTKIDLTLAESTDASGVFVPSNKDYEAGTLKVTIPNATRIMHVFANQKNVPFVKGMDEYSDELMNLAATPNTMVYWARIEIPNGVTTKDWAEGEYPKTVSLLRNMARVEVVNNNTDEFTLLGYAVVNTKEFGTAVPACQVDENEYLYPTSNVSDDEGFSLTEWIKADYSNPIGEIIDINDVPLEEIVGTNNGKQTGNPIYVYETSVSSEDPASIIIYGSNNSEPGKKLYWRVEFADDKGVHDIRRNHRYTVNIEGHILGGYDNIYAALANDPVGVKLDIAPEVTAIKNCDFSLTVENTSYVLPDGTGSLTFNFSIEQLGDEVFEFEWLSDDEQRLKDLKVEWDNGHEQNVSSTDDVTYDFEVVNTIFKATVTVPLEPLEEGKDKQTGTIVINYAGRLERKIEIEVIPLQQFTINSYNGIVPPENEEAGIVNFDLAEWDYTLPDYFMVVDESKPTIPIDRLKFSIPEGFPNALYPFNVLISTNDLNAWDCPLIFPGDNRYGEDNGIGYKYVYRIDGPEDYYEVILRSIDRNLIAQEVELTLESEYFEPVTLHIIYPDYGN